MQDEAAITVNDIRLTHNESRIVRLALATFADIIANQLGFKDDGIPLTDQYQTDTATSSPLIEGQGSAHLKTRWADHRSVPTLRAN